MNSRQGKNIGTLSININAPDFNYGAILHSWAFQHYLTGSGLAAETEIINYKMPQVELFNRWLPIRYYFSLGKRRKALEILKKYRIYGGRLLKFNRFIRKDLFKKLSCFRSLHSYGNLRLFGVFANKNLSRTI